MDRQIEELKLRTAIPPYYCPFGWEPPQDQKQVELLREILARATFQSGIAIDFDNGKFGFIPARGGTAEYYRVVDRDMEKSMPGVTERLNSESGKVVFLGNGFNQMPLIIANRFRQQLVTQPPVIVDIFDSSKLFEDFNNLQTDFGRKQIDFPFQQLLRRFKLYDVEIQNGSLISVQYQIGNGRVPETMKNASLALNAFGPSDKTIEEQLSILRVGGELWITNSDPVVNSDKYDKRYSKKEQITGNLRIPAATIFTRKA